MASERRCEICCASCGGRADSAAEAKAKSAKDVGSTQLEVRGVHPQPRNSSLCDSCFADLKDFRNLCQRLESRGESSESHCSAARTFFAPAGNWARVSAASDVSDPPEDMPFMAGQEPSGSCCAFRNSRPRAMGCADSAEFARARRAQQVGSARLWPPALKGQPPSEFCVARRCKKRLVRRGGEDSLICDAVKGADGFIACLRVMFP